MVADQQLVLLRQKLTEGKPKRVAAAAMSERSARKCQPGELPSERNWAGGNWSARPAYHPERFALFLPSTTGNWMRCQPWA